MSRRAPPATKPNRWTILAIPVEYLAGSLAPDCCSMFMRTPNWCCTKLLAKLDPSAAGGRWLPLVFVIRSPVLSQLVGGAQAKIKYNLSAGIHGNPPRRHNDKARARISAPFSLLFVLLRPPGHIIWLPDRGAAGSKPKQIAPDDKLVDQDSF